MYVNVIYFKWAPVLVTGEVPVVRARHNNQSKSDDHLMITFNIYYLSLTVIIRQQMCSVLTAE